MCQVVTLGDLMKRIDAMHARLTLEILDILMAAGCIRQDAPATYAATELLGSPEFQASLAGISTQKSRLETELVPELATNVVLVWACMQALPDILTGMLLQKLWQLNAHGEFILHFTMLCGQEMLVMHFCTSKHASRGLLAQG